MPKKEMEGALPAGDRINRRRVGTDKEELAAAFLESRGLRILEHNFRCRQGEIDLIARDGEYLVFVEVKYRKSREFGDAAGAVGPAKQKTICRVADFYRLSRGLGEGTSVRYDVVAIQGEEVRWIPNAFFHRYR